MRYIRSLTFGLIVGIAIASLGTWASLTQWHRAAETAGSLPAALVGAAVINAFLLISVAAALIHHLRSGHPIRRTGVTWVSEDEYIVDHSYRIGPLHHLSGRALLIQAKVTAPRVQGPVSFRLRPPIRDFINLRAGLCTLGGDTVEGSEHAAVVSCYVDWDACDEQRKDMADIEIPVPNRADDRSLFLTLSLQPHPTGDRHGTGEAPTSVRIKLQLGVAERLHANAVIPAADLQGAQWSDTGAVM